MDINIHRVKEIIMGPCEKETTQHGSVYFIKRVMIKHTDYLGNMQETRIDLFGDDAF